MRLLVTGASGTLGRYLVPELRKRGHQVTALIHNPARMPRWDGVRFVLGDITRPDLGIKERLEVDGIVHLAAVVSFSRKDREALRRVNLDGTVNVALKALEAGAHLFHVSTAYVCGDYKGHFLPESLNLGQKHRNYYERSKFEAEMFVRGCSGLRWTVLRPSILIGDSKVTALPPPAGYYWTVKAIDSAKRWAEQRLALPHMELVIRIKAKPDATLNLIPIDIAARQMAEIISKGATGSYHIVHPSPVTIEELSKVVSEVVGAWVVPQMDFSKNPAERLVERMIRDIIPYLQGEPRFDCTSTMNLVETYCPRLEHGFLVESTRRFLEG